jgi:hypothetical protein
MGIGRVRSALIISIFYFASLDCGLFAQQLSVTYIDVDAQVRNGSTGTALSIGDDVSLQSSIQLSNDTYVELTQAGSKVIRTQSGSDLSGDA